MSWFTALAIYFLFWVFCLFLVLPYGVRSTAEVGGEMVPGQSTGAPHTVSIPKKLIATTILSSVLFAVFWLNWENGWLTRADIEDFLFSTIYKDL